VRAPTAPALVAAVRGPLVGREREIAAAEALVAGGARLLTLTGPGGSGKTRLALEVAHRLAERHADGAVVVPLAAVAAADLVPGAVAQALGVREGAADGAGPAARYLAARELLLVLDNCEHVLDAAPYVAALLAAAPRLTVLVTSREPLRIAPEQELPVPPLSLPPAATSARAVGEADAVRLFVQRARAGRPDFALTDANAGDVAAVCRRLDGLPLAIELAAARARLLSPRALLARLDARPDGTGPELLRSDARDAEPRHRTLRDVIDWSYALLAPDERRLFRELAAFAGGFTLDAAAAVTTAPPGAPDALDRVASLCDKSLLVRREQPDGEPRFQMLETVREYALARLREAGEEDAARAAHARYFAAFAEAAEPHLFAGAGNRAWVARVRDDVDNLRAAAVWAAADDGRAADALRLGAAVNWYWFAAGQYQEPRERLAAALARAAGVPPDSPAADATLRGRALTALAMLALWQGDTPAIRPHAEAALALLGAAAPAAPAARAAALVAVAGGHVLEGDGVAAGRRADEGLAVAAALPPSPLHSLLLYWRGWAALVRGEADVARAALEAAVANGRLVRHPPAVGHSLAMLGRLAFAAGDHDAARAYYAEGLAIHVRTDDAWGIAIGLEGMAGVAAAGARHRAAAQLLGAADSVRVRLASVLSPAERSEHEHLVAALRDALGDAFEPAWDAGQALSPEAALRLATADG
jgi:predicted ATPase